MLIIQPQQVAEPAGLFPKCFQGGTLGLRRGVHSPEGRGQRMQPSKAQYLVSREGSSQMVPTFDPNSSVLEAKGKDVADPPRAQGQPPSFHGARQLREATEAPCAPRVGTKCGLLEGVLGPLSQQGHSSSPHLPDLLLQMPGFSRAPQWVALPPQDTGLGPPFQNRFEAKQ